MNLYQKTVLQSLCRIYEVKFLYWLHSQKQKPLYSLCLILIVWWMIKIIWFINKQNTWNPCEKNEVKLVLPSSPISDWRIFLNIFIYCSYITCKQLHTILKIWATIKTGNHDRRYWILQQNIWNRIRRSR